jgi:hypothetical protein
MVPSHFQAPPRPPVHKGGSGAWTYARARRRSSIPTTSRLLPTFSGGGSWAEPLLQTAHRRIPAERVRFRPSPSCFRPPPLVPGLFFFRARVILRTDGPTRSTQRLPGRGAVSTFPPPEPPLLLVLLGVAPSPGRNRGLSLVTVTKLAFCFPSFHRFPRPDRAFLIL